MELLLFVFDIKLAIFNDNTGKTHGMKFRINPANKAKEIKYK